MSQWGRLGIHLVWAGLGLVAFGALALGPSSMPASAAVTLDPEEQAAFNQLNVERTSRGLPAVRLSPTLQAASEWMAVDMIGNSTPTSLSHTDSLGRDIRARFTAFGYTPNSSIRENINAGHRTGLESMQAWMDSPGHRVNNLAEDVKVVGLALVVRPGTTFTYYWALAFGSVDDSESSAVSPTPAAPAAAVNVTGSVPAVGVALLQAGAAGGAEDLIAGLSQRGCRATSIWLITSGSLLGYTAGAPAFVNTAFPATIAAGTPFLAVCR